MTDKYYKRFIKTLAALSPDTPPNPTKSLSTLKSHGLDKFIQKAGGSTAELAEIAELLTRMDKRGVRHESG